MTLLHTSCTPDTNVYIIISTRMTKDSVFLSGKCTVLCYILEYDIPYENAIYVTYRAIIGDI